MIKPEDLHNLLSPEFDGAEITIQDMTGTEDHYEITVAWQGFQGMNLVNQHQLVNQSLKGPLGDGRLHAVKIKTITL